MKKKTTLKKVIGVAVTQDVVSFLTAEAAKEQLSRSDIIRRILTKAMEGSHEGDRSSSAM